MPFPDKYFLPSADNLPAQACARESGQGVLRTTTRDRRAIMGAARKSFDNRVLKDFVPLNALSPSNFNEVARKAEFDVIKAGQPLFEAGANDAQTLFLIAGELELVNPEGQVSRLRAGSDAARHPLAPQQPRQVTARARGQCTVARIDSNLLDILLAWDESDGYEVLDVSAEEDDDWITRLLQTEAFSRLPPSNIHEILVRIEPVEFSCGDIVVCQGDAGDYFYIIKQGECEVTRRDNDGREQKLAQLHTGDCFGEEALLSDARRNASVRMTRDGCLMRLAKQDFIELLQQNVVKEVAYDAGQALVADGAKWLDVRLPEEFSVAAIPGAVNVPMSVLREHTIDLKQGSDAYVVVCDTGRRSANAAFVLGQYGIDVYVLAGGMHACPDIPASPESRADPDKPEADSELRPAAHQSITDEKELSLLRDKLASVSAQLARELENQLALHQEANLVKQAMERQAQESDRDLQRVREEKLVLETKLNEAIQSSDTARQELSELQKQLQSGADQSALQAQAVERLQIELEKQRSVVEQKNTELERLRAEADRLQGLVSELESSVEGHAAKLAEQEQVFKSSQTDSQMFIDNLEERIKQLEEERSRAEQALMQAEQDTASESARAAITETSLAEVREQLTQAIRELDESRTAHAETEARLQESSTRYKTQLAELATLKDQIETRQSDAEQSEQQLRKELSSALDAISELQTNHEQVLIAQQRSVDEFEEKLSSLESLLASERERSEKLAHGLDEATAELAARGQRLDELSRELAETERARDELRRDRDMATSSAGELEERLSQSLAQLQEDAAQQVASLNNEIAAISSDRDAMRESLQDRDVRLAALQEALEALKAETTRGRSDLEAQLASAQEQLALLQERSRIESESSVEEKARLRADLEQERNALLESRAEVQRLQQALKQLKEESDEALEVKKRELDELHSETQRLESEMEVKSRLVGDLESGIEHLQGELESAVSMQNDLRDSLNDVQQAFEQTRATLAERDEVLAGMRREQESQSMAYQELEVSAAATQSALEKTVLDLEARLGERDRAIDVLGSEKSRLMARTADLEQEASMLVDARQGVESELAEVAERLQRSEQRAEGTRERFQSQLDSVSEEARSLREEIARICTERDAARATSIEHQNALEQLREELGSSRSEAEGETLVLREQIESLRRELSDSDAARCEAEESLETERTRLEELRNDMRSAELEAHAGQEALTDQIRVKEQANKALREERDKALKELDAARVLADRHQQVLEQFREEVGAAQSDADGEVLLLREQINELQSERDAATAALHQITEQLEMQRRKTTDLETELSAVQVSSSERVTDLETTLRQLEEERAREIEQHEAAVLAMTAEQSSLNERIVDLQGYVDTIAGERDEYRKNIDSLNIKAFAQTDSNQQIVNEQQAKLVELGSRCEQLEQERSHLAEERELAQQRISGLEKEISAAAEQRNVIESEIESLRIALSAAEKASTLPTDDGENAQDTENLRITVDRLSAELEAAREALTVSPDPDEFDALQRRVTELTERADEEHQVLREQLASANAAIDGAGTMAADLESRTAEVEYFKEKIERLTDKLEAAEEEASRWRGQAEVNAALAESGSQPAASSDDTQAIRSQLAMARETLEVAERKQGESAAAAERAQRETARLRSALKEANEQLARLEARSDDKPETVVVVKTAVEEKIDGPRFSNPVFGVVPRPFWLLVAMIAGLALGYFVPRTVSEPVAVESDVPGQNRDAGRARVVMPAIKTPERPDVRKPTAAPDKEKRPVTSKQLVSKQKNENRNSVAARPRVERKRVRPGRLFRDTFENGDSGPLLRRLPAGRFMMGSGDTSPRFEERPRHAVRVGSFSISRFEVTFAEYDRFAEATGRSRPDDAGWGRGDRPVINVSWDDARAYAVWLSGQTGYQYRLPTEAEWEYAARAGVTSPFWWEENEAPSANCFDCPHAQNGERTSPVGDYSANAFGLQDVAGNVQEWVEDCYRDSYRGAPADGSARGQEKCEKRVVRGGSYLTPSSELRPARRYAKEPGARLDSVGFRLVRSDS